MIQVWFIMWKLLSFKHRTNGFVPFEWRLLKISKLDLAPSSPSIPQSLPVMGDGWQTLPTTLSSPAQGSGCSSPRGLSLYNPDVLITPLPFGPLVSWMLHLVLLTPLSFPLYLPHGPAQAVMSRLDSPRWPWIWLYSPPYPQWTFSSTPPRRSQVLSFPFSFFITPHKKKTVSKLLTIGSRFLVEREGKGTGVGFEMVNCPMPWLGQWLFDWNYKTSRHIYSLEVRM